MKLLSNEIRKIKIYKILFTNEKHGFSSEITFIKLFVTKNKKATSQEKIDIGSVKILEFSSQNKIFLNI